MKTSYLKLVLGLFLASVLALSSHAQQDTTKAKEIVSDLSEPDIPKWGEDSTKCVRNFSLYREYYKNYKRSKDAGKLDEAEDYIKSAIDPWRYVFNNCPIASQNTYRDGANIIEFLIKNAEDIDKAAYADTLMMVYDQRMEMYGWKEGVGYILGRKAVAHLNYKKGNEAKSFKLFEMAFDRTKEEDYNAAVLYYHMLAAVKMFKSGKAEKQIIIKTYDKISQVFQDKIDDKAEDYKSYEKLQPRIERLFNPFADCDDLISIFKDQYDESPEDPDLLKRIISILDDQGCTDSDLYFNATKSLHELEPSAESAFLMGKMSINREIYDEATKYLKEAANKFEDSTKINKAYYILANINKKQGNRTTARDNARKALEYDPDDGRCYILIGDLYADSDDACKTDSKVESKSIYWAAVDKYKKAKSVDPDVADKAEKKIATYRQYFPSQEELFFEDYNPGNSFTVGCWIDETTTIRKK
ncbi:MAG: tetratricopeptide repeat protein [Bacteroidota bacterium]